MTELLTLANVGAGIFKLEAIESIWVSAASSVERNDRLLLMLNTTYHMQQSTLHTPGQPQSLLLLEAMNLICKIAAPSVLFEVSKRQDAKP